MISLPEYEYVDDPTVYDGRPADCTGRLEKEIRVYDTLDSLKIPYKRLDHKAAFSIGECNERADLLGITISKNLFLCNTQKTKFYLLMMPGEKRFHTKIFSHQIGSARLSFAPEEYMEEFLDTTPGSASVMGLMNDKDCRVELYIDADVLKQEYIGCHPCINTSSLKIKTSDLTDVYLPAVHHRHRVVFQPWDEE